jgi:hypothetical protein
MRTFMPLLLITVALVGCGDKDDSGETGAPVLSGACELAAEIEACPECADGDVTCSYGDESVTELSCGDCQARSSLLNALCDAEIEDERAEIEAGLSCSDPE